MVPVLIIKIVLATADARYAYYCYSQSNREMEITIYCSKLIQELIKVKNVLVLILKLCSEYMTKTNTLWIKIYV